MNHCLGAASSWPGFFFSTQRQASEMIMRGEEDENRNAKNTSNDESVCLEFKSSCSSHRIKFKFKEKTVQDEKR